MDNTYVAVDIETTGLDPRYDRIIEIGAVRVKNGEVAEVFQTFINPNCAIPLKIVELTGIDSTMLIGAPEISKALEQFLSFVKEDILLGHNVIFDYSFLKLNALNMGIKFERLGIDTLRIARKLLPDLTHKSLTALCEHYKIINEHAHRAVDDAISALKLYQRMRNEFLTKENVKNVEELFEPVPLVYQMKKESPITQAQLKYLKALLKYHNLTSPEEPESLSKNEASRRIDKIILQYGKCY